MSNHGNYWHRIAKPDSAAQQEYCGCCKTISFIPALLALSLMSLEFLLNLVFMQLYGLPMIYLLT